MTEITKLNNYLSAENIHIFYLTINPEKAIGPEKLLSNYHIICSLDNDFFKNLIHLNADNHFCTEGLTTINNAHELLEVPEVIKFINGFNPSRIIIQSFKVSPRLEILANQRGWELAVCSSEMNKYYEDKFNLIEIAQLANCKIPPSEILEISNVFDKIDETPFVLQFPRGHTGNGTFIVKEKNDLFDIQNKYPDSLMKKSAFVDGFTLNVNAVVDDVNVRVAGLNIQVNGVKELSTSQAVTCGNNYDYEYALKDILLKTPEFQNDVIDICESLGKVMRSKGFMGLFGIDLILDTISQSLYLIEINARQTANVSYYNLVQISNSQIQLSILNLCTFLNFKIEVPTEYSFENTKPSKNGQLICRNYMMDNFKPKNAVVKIIDGLKYFGPGNSPLKKEEEVFRIQSNLGICDKGVVKSEILENLREIKNTIGLDF